MLERDLAIADVALSVGLVRVVTARAGIVGAAAVAARIAALVRAAAARIAGVGAAAIAAVLTLGAAVRTARICGICGICVTFSLLAALVGAGAFALAFLSISAVGNALVVAALGILEQDVDDADEGLAGSGLGGVLLQGRVGEVLRGEADALIEVDHLATELERHATVALGASSGTRVVGGDERVVGLFEGSVVGRDAERVHVLLGELLPEVVEEALDDGGLLLVGELRDARTVLRKQVRLHRVAQGREGCVVVGQLDQLEAQADALVDLVTLEVGGLHGCRELAARGDIHLVDELLQRLVVGCGNVAHAEILGVRHGPLHVDEEGGDLRVVQLGDRETVDCEH